VALNEHFDKQSSSYERWGQFECNGLNWYIPYFYRMTTQLGWPKGQMVCSYSADAFHNDSQES